MDMEGVIFKIRSEDLWYCPACGAKLEDHGLLEAEKGLVWKITCPDCRWQIRKELD